MGGRLRIKIPEVKAAPLQAREVESRVRLLTGMLEVSANPVTGNVLMIYDPRRLREEQIIAALEERVTWRKLANPGRTPAGKGPWSGSSPWWLPPSWKQPWAAWLPP